MNGSVMPLAGIRCRLTAMLIAALHAEQHRQAGGREAAEGILVARGGHQAAHDDEGEDGTMTRQTDDAELLGCDGEDEIGVGVGQDALDRALARALAEPAAAHESFERGVDLECVADAMRRTRIDEL